MATSGYRRILRSINFAFRGDQLAIKMAKNQLRAEFLKNAAATNMAKHMAELDELDEMLRFHIVQGKRSGNDGNFEVELREEHHATIAANQHLQHGPELEPIDPSYMGKSNTILVSKTKGDRKPIDPKELI